MLKAHSEKPSWTHWDILPTSNSETSCTWTMTENVYQRRYSTVPWMLCIMVHINQKHAKTFAPLQSGSDAEVPRNKSGSPLPRSCHMTQATGLKYWVLLQVNLYWEPLQGTFQRSTRRSSYTVTTKGCWTMAVKLRKSENKSGPTQSSACKT